jgi:undecaprenyl-diphosphatase
MNSFDAIIYGVIQGLSEFLPVSSSGHLALLPKIMQIDDPGVVFDLMMHLGTALAVLTYFRREIFTYSKTLRPSLINFSQGSPSQWFSRNFIFSTLVSIVLIVLLIPISKMARDPNIIIFNLIFFGGLLWFADNQNLKRLQHLESPMEQRMQWKLAALIGASQALAIFPGVSRSGITLSMALLLGMKRKEAGAFSFLMSLPIILAGILKEIPELLFASQERILILFLGVATSFLIGLLTIHFFMKLISKIKLAYFAIYRWVLAIAMLILLN